EAAVAANRDGVRPDAVGQRHAADPRSRRLVAANVELERLNRFERAVARRVKPIDTGRALAYREAVRIERVEIEAGAARKHRLVVAKARRRAREELARGLRPSVDQVHAAGAGRAA